MSGSMIHKNHRKRMRKRFTETGGSGFSEHELLEMLLFGSVPRGNTNPAAHLLLDRFGSLKNVLSADLNEITQINGVGEASARLIAVFSEACKRYLETSAERRIFTTKQELSDFITALCSDITFPSLILIFLDWQMALVAVETFQLDTLLADTNITRTLSTHLLKNGHERFAAVFVHPNSQPIPDITDYRITRTAADISASIKNDFIDSFVFGNGRLFSMRASGAFSF